MASDCTRTTNSDKLGKNDTVFGSAGGQGPGMMRCLNLRLCIAHSNIEQETEEIRHNKPETPSEQVMLQIVLFIISVSDNHDKNDDSPLLLLQSTGYVIKIIAKRKKKAVPAGTRKLKFSHRGEMEVNKNSNKRWRPGGVRYGNEHGQLRGL